MRWGEAADRAYETYFARAILDSRSTVHLSYRLCVRLAWLIDPVGRATAGAGLWHRVLPAFMVLDVGIWLALRRNPGLGLAWRLAIDSADVAFWSLSPLPPSGFYDSAVFIGIPLALESGFRLNLRGLVVPATALIVMAIVRTAAGRAVLPFTIMWLVLAVGIGMVFYIYCRRLHDEAEAERASLGEAESRRAFLGGQNSVAMGASSVVDAIEGVVPVLGRPRPGSALWQLAAGWKARLGEMTRGDATYLLVALLEWERHHNEHPDLAGHVRLQAEEGAGTTLLTTSQVGALARSLDALALHGTNVVALAGSSGRSGLPGRSLRIRVGPHLVLVPPDAGAIQRPVDPAPVSFLFIAAQCLTMAAPGGGLVPLWVVAATDAVFLGALWWSHRALLLRGSAARPAILRTAVVLAVVLSATQMKAQTADLTPDGTAVYAGIGLMLIAEVGGLYWYGMPARRKALLVGGVAASAAATLLLSAGPLQGRTFLAMAITNLAIFPLTRRISISLGQAREKHVRDARDEDQAATLAAFRRGQDVVVSLVRQARDDAYRQLSVLGTSLDPAVAKMVTRRLEEVDKRLTRIDEPPASWSSMTTS